MLQTPFAWTDQKKAAVIQMYAENASLSEIAAQFSISPNKVSKFIARHRDQCPIRPNEFWTESTTNILREMYGKGFKFSEIGKKVGCSTNAALGKAHRLGLVPLRRVGAPSVSKKVKKTKPSGLLQSLTGMAMQAPKDFAFRGYRHAGKTVADNVPVRFDELEGCKWPLYDMADAEGPHTLCCGGKMTRGSFCEHHALLAYTPRKSGSAPIMDRGARG